MPPSAKKRGLLATTRELVCALPGCDVAFTTRKPNRRYCSKAHTQLAGADRSGRGAGRHFPRVRYAARLAIFKRDGWTCQLCHAPIDRDRRFPDPGSASIDHRDPAGAHDPSNWQAAHLACNVSKSAKVAIGADPKLRQVAA
jgi:5-methylcytosine-specific restriction endonuclease McrA